MAIQLYQIAKEADNLVKRLGTRNPFQLAADLDITVLEVPFEAQRGAYKLLLRQPFIFLKEDLHPAMKGIVGCHEIGHHILHRDKAIATGGFSEFQLFDMAGKRMEYEANIFAAELMLPNDEVLDYIYQGFDIEQIAKAMRSDINLVALKCDTLRFLGYPLRPQQHQSNFLRYDKA